MLPSSISYKCKVLPVTANLFHLRLQRTAFWQVSVSPDPRPLVRQAQLRAVGLQQPARGPRPLSDICRRDREGPHCSTAVRPGLGQSFREHRARQGGERRRPPHREMDDRRLRMYGFGENLQLMGRFGQKQEVAERSQHRKVSVVGAQHVMGRWCEMGVCRRQVSFMRDCWPVGMSPEPQQTGHQVVCRPRTHPGSALSPELFCH